MREDLDPVDHAWSTLTVVRIWDRNGVWDMELLLDIRVGLFRALLTMVGREFAFFKNLFCYYLLLFIDLPMYFLDIWRRVVLSIAVDRIMWENSEERKREKLKARYGDIIMIYIFF